MGFLRVLISPSHLTVAVPHLRVGDFGGMGVRRVRVCLVFLIVHLFAVSVFQVSGFSVTIPPKLMPRSISRVSARSFDKRLIRGPAMSMTGSDDDGEPPRRMEGDWRAFRNRLIQSHQSSDKNSTVEATSR